MSLFAVATVFNMNIAEQGNAGDVSLDAIAVMAQGQNELSTDIPWSSYSTGMQRQMEMASNPWSKYSSNYYVAKCAYRICDEWDLTGDPVFDGNNRQVDDCDGQPNRC